MRVSSLPIAIVISASLTACGGGGGGGYASPTGNSGGGGSSVPPPKTVIKFDPNDSTYRIPAPGDQITYDVDVTYRDYDVFGVLSESEESTTLDLDFFAPSSNISGDIKNIQENAEELGYVPLKVVRTLASGNDSDSAILAFREDFVTELYDDDGFYYEQREEGPVLLVELPPLVEGQSFEQPYYQLPNGYVPQSGSAFWEGVREINVGAIEEVETFVDEIEAAKIIYSDIKVEVEQYTGGRVVLQARSTTGTVWIHPKIGIVKASLTFREDTDALTIDEIFEGEYVQQDATWVLRSVNFNTPAPE